MTDFIIDAHQHVWDPSRAEYDWLGPELAPINRAIGFDELLPHLRRAGIAGTVMVESADNDEDTELMLEAAAAHPEVLAIVAFAPLDQPAAVSHHLESFRGNSLIVGARNLIHNNPDPEWLLRPDVDEGLGLLETAGLTFDLVSVLPEHLALVPTLTSRHPELRIVIDHLSKPPVGLTDNEPWWSLIAEAAKSPNVFAKVSGLYSATADSSAWTPDLIRPFLHHALEAFGADRLMYGGDWPISVLSGGYDRVWGGLSQLFDELTSTERRNVLGGTAESFYHIDQMRIAAVRGEFR
jgi:L-fuconolactonase